MAMGPDGEVLFSPDCPEAGEMANGFVLGPGVVGLVVEGFAGGPLPNEETAVFGIAFSDPVSGAGGGIRLAPMPERIRIVDIPPNFVANVLGCIARCRGRTPDGACGAFREGELQKLLRSEQR